MHGINTKPKSNTLKHHKTTRSSNSNRNLQEQVEPLENESNFQKYKSKGSGSKHKSVGSQTRNYPEVVIACVMQTGILFKS